MARRHTPEQVIAKVRQGQKMLNDGRPMVEVVKELQVTEATWYRWVNQYGSEHNASQTKAVRELEKENTPLTAATTAPLSVAINRPVSTTRRRRQRDSYKRP